MASQLIEELKKEHLFIVSRFDEAKRLGAHTPEGMKALVSAKKALLAHLAKEDSKLYPVLNEAAKGEFELSTLLQIMGKDMQQLSANVVEFFGKYESGARPDTMTFARDFGALAARLTSRVRSEESTLYAHYDRLASKR